MRHFVVLRSLWTRGISFLTGWIHGKENRDIDENFTMELYTSPTFVTGTLERNGSQYRNTRILIRIIRMIRFRIEQFNISKIKFIIHQL
ncbi:unnamed protein product [Rhizophagus irregularis]|nr:unnamed protein product [Rhizophagus irregularis]